MFFCNNQIIEPDNSSNHSDSDSESNTENSQHDYVEVKLTQFEQLAKQFPKTDLFEKQQQYFSLFEIRKVKRVIEIYQRMFLLDEKIDQFVFLVKNAYDLPLAAHQGEVFLMHLIKLEFDQSIKQLDDAFNLSNAVLSLLNDIISKVKGQFVKVSFIQRLNNEWGKKYYKLDEEAAKDIQFGIIPTLTQYWHCLVEYDDKVVCHVDFLVSLYKILVKYSQKCECKYEFAIKQLQLCFMILQINGFQNRDAIEDGTLKVVIKSISELEVGQLQNIFKIKLFNDQFQTLIRDFTDEFILGDLQEFNPVINAESFKWLFKRLQDRYEKKLQIFMNRDSILSTTDKCQLLSLLCECIQLFQTQEFCCVMNISISSLMPELLGYYDEVLTIIPCQDAKVQLVIQKALMLVIGAFKMIRKPFQETNFFMVKNTLKEKQGQTHLNTIMDDRFNLHSLLELYIANSFVKESSKNLRAHTFLMELQCRYFLNEDCTEFFQSLPQTHFYYATCGMITLICELKVNLKCKFTHRLRFELERFYHDARRSRLEHNVSNQYIQTIQEFYESVRYLQFIESSNDDLKALYSVYKQIQLSEVFQNQALIEDPNFEVFGLPLSLLVSITGEIYSLLYLLKQKLYNEFLEQQYYFQMNLMTKINQYLKKNFYYRQFWKYITLAIDLTSRVINQTEMFQLSLADKSFSFAHVERGFKILRIILEESILKIFSDPSVLQSQEDQQAEQFKPKIKVIFHGIEDLNIENPRQGQLDLEIVMQTAKDQFVRLRVQDNQLKWGYSQLEKLNAVVNVLLPIMNICIDLWFKFIPKEYLEYQELIIKQSQQNQIDSDLVSAWLSTEKPLIKHSQEALIQLFESFEFWLMKTEGSLMKEIQFYNQHAKPLANQFENVSKFLNDQGLNVDQEMWSSLETKIYSSLKKQLDGYIQPVKIATNKMKNYLANLRKLPFWINK